MISFCLEKFLFAISFSWWQSESVWNARYLWATSYYWVPCMAPWDAAHQHCTVTSSVALGLWRRADPALTLMRWPHKLTPETRDKRQVQGVWRSCECFLFAPKEKGTKECNKTRNWIILLLLYFGWKVARWQRSDSAEDIKCPITIFQLQLLTRSAIL